MSAPEVVERHLGFGEYQTYCRVTGVEGHGLTTPGVRPLVILHGGPGCTHDYVLSLTDLAAPDRVVVHYDQLGNGRSTHLPDAALDFWSIELFLDELDRVLKSLGIDDDYDLLGQSWGGILAAEHAVRQPRGLRRLVLANSLPSMSLWMDAAQRLRAELPVDVQRVLDEHEASGTIDSAQYREASDEYYRRHVCRIVPNPPEVARTFTWIDEDPTVYHAMNGPTEFHVVGHLRTWSIIDRLSLISAPTLVLNGAFDEATDEVIAPFLSHISDVRWHRFEHSSHMPHVEERAEFMDVVDRFLRE